MVSVYDPLKAFLEAQPGKTIQLSFGQIETILNRSLPTAAHHHDWWWANEDVEENEARSMQIVAECGMAGVND